MQVLTETFVFPFTACPLLCISNGAVATEKVCSDLANAKTIGKNRMNTFTEERLSGNKSLFDSIKKLKLKTFSSMTKTVMTCSDKKMIPMKATRNLFGQRALIMQNRNISLKKVFCYPLGPIPCSLGVPWETFERKTKLQSSTSRRREYTQSKKSQQAMQQ